MTGKICSEQKIRRRTDKYRIFMKPQNPIVMKTFYFFLFCMVAAGLAQEDAAPSIEVFATGLNSPVDIKNAGDERLFVVQQTGSIRVVQGDGSVNDTPFLSLDVNDSGSEQGLLGIAFHPEYASNGHFFVNYIRSNGDTQISRFTVSNDPDVANAGSELSILNIPQPFANHNGGCMQFGPDGFLYIGLGDGGSGGDPGNRSQNPGTLLGKILRIDIDNPSNGNNYGIPSDNPFVGVTNTLDEIWALGVRNPWKFSFDALTGELWIADVGQNEIEEINKENGTVGGLNYGWRCYEGNSPFNTSGCPDDSVLSFPFVDYSHTGNGAFKCSVTGGYVYRGDDFSGMQGLYIFGDFCSDEIGTVDSDGNLSFFDTSPGGLSSFGEDVNHELYVAGLGAGIIYRVIDANLSVETFATQNMSIYPNPAQGEARLYITQFSGKETLNLYDLNGKRVRHIQISQDQTTFSVADLAAGIYIARVSSAPQIIKLVVQ